MLDTLAYYAILAYIVHKLICFASRFIKVPELDQKYVFITGCDTGFGYQASLRLQAAGMKVISACLFEKGAKELQAEAAGASGRGTIKTLVMDVTKDDSVKAALAEIKAYVGNKGLHALINNAGVLRGELLDTMSMDDWNFQLNVNVVGSARVAKAMLPLIVQARGRIINVASVAGIFGTEGTVAYNASKFAVVGMTDAMRRELADWGVKVSMVLPGIMNTPLWEVPLDPKNIDRIWNSLSADQKEFYGSKQLFVDMFTEAKALVKLVNGDPKLVIDAMEQAVTSRFPFRRYYAGYDTFMFRFLAMLPDCAGDFLWAARHYALHTKPVIPIGVRKRKD